MEGEEYSAMEHGPCVRCFPITRSSQEPVSQHRSVAQRRKMRPRDEEMIRTRGYAAGELEFRPRTDSKVPEKSVLPPAKNMALPSDRL